MTLADKITNLRKKMGWSQEQLAEHLNIPRQSVSKWESGTSVPKLDKIIKMSDIFGVTTDYLLKAMNKIGEEPTYDEATCDSAKKSQNEPQKNLQDTVRKISWEEAVAIMDLVREVSPKIALGVTLCILSPIFLLLLGAIAEHWSLMSENIAGGIGAIILLVFVASGVGHLIFMA